MVWAKLVHPVELYVPNLIFLLIFFAASIFFSSNNFLVIVMDAGGKTKEAENETDESNEIKTKKLKIKYVHFCGATGFPLSFISFQAPGSVDPGSCTVQAQFCF